MLYVVILLAVIGFAGYIFNPKTSGVPELSYPEPSYIIKLMIVRAYCPCELCCGRWADGYTANGWEIQSGDKFVAADPNIPFLTLVYVPGYSDIFVPVRDRGAAVTGNRMEVFFHTHEEALEWGKQKLWVKIMR